MKSLREVEEEDADGCECCLQWSLLLFNIPVLLIGIALVVLGAWTMADRSFVADLQLQASGSLFTALVIIFIVAGVVLMAVAVLGCVAAFLESRRVLLGYYGCVLVLFLLLTIAIMLGFIYGMKVEDSLKDDLVQSVLEYDPES